MALSFLLAKPFQSLRTRIHFPGRVRLFQLSRASLHFDCAGTLPPLELPSIKKTFCAQPPQPFSVFLFSLLVDDSVLAPHHKDESNRVTHFLRSVITTNVLDRMSTQTRACEAGLPALFFCLSRAILSLSCNCL